MHAFWLSLGMVFLAELGDKTQLVSLTLASRFSAWVTLAGIFTATLAVHVFSVLIGGAAGELLPAEWVRFIAGLAFIGFGFWTLRGDCLDGEECSTRRPRSPFMLVAVTFFLAELGDKTMLSTVALATTNPILPVWIGSSLGMVVSDGLAIIVGTILGSRLPERAIKVGASAIFFAFGALSITQGLLVLPSVMWLIGCAAVVVMLQMYRRSARPSKKAA